MTERRLRQGNLIGAGGYHLDGGRLHRRLRAARAAIQRRGQRHRHDGRARGGSQPFRASEAAIRGFWKHYRALMGADVARGSMDDIAIRLGVAGTDRRRMPSCIDEDRLEEWPDLFAEPCRYLVISRADHEAGMRQGVMYAASRGMLLDRVFCDAHGQYVRAAPLPPRCRSDPGEGGSTAMSRSCTRTSSSRGSCTMATRSCSPPAAIWTGSISSAAPYRFIERIVVLDSDKIDTLLAIPL